jgi:hypothetical protein
MFKIIDGVTYIFSKGIYIPIDEKASDRKNSWITLRQITLEYPEFFDKVEEIFTKTSPSYNDKAKNYATSIMRFLELWEWISWKQFDSIWRISSTYEDFIQGKNQGFYKFGSVVSIQSHGLSFTSREHVIPEFSRITTDREMDTWHEKLFGHRPHFEEEEVEGLSVSYRKDGSRFFALPTGDESLGDFMHFGINFKGLRI